MRVYSTQFAYSPADRPDGDDLALLLRLVRRGRLHPETGRVLPWDRTADVIDGIRGRRVRGIAMLTLSAG